MIGLRHIGGVTVDLIIAIGIGDGIRHTTEELGDIMTHIGIGDLDGTHIMAGMAVGRILITDIIGDITTTTTHIGDMGTTEVDIIAQITITQIEELKPMVELLLLTIAIVEPAHQAVQVLPLQVEQIAIKAVLLHQETHIL